MNSQCNDENGVGVGELAELRHRQQEVEDCVRHLKNDDHRYDAVQNIHNQQSIDPINQSGEKHSRTSSRRPSLKILVIFNSPINGRQ